MAISLCVCGGNANIFAVKGNANKIITAMEFFKQLPEDRKPLWGREFWSDGKYIGTVSDGVMSEIMQNYEETQGPLKRKMATRR